MSVNVYVTQFATIPAAVSAINGSQIGAVQISGPVIDQDAVTVIASPQTTVAMEADCTYFRVQNRKASTAAVFVGQGGSSDELAQDVGHLIEISDSQWVVREAGETHILLTAET